MRPIVLRTSAAASNMCDARKCKVAKDTAAGCYFHIPARTSLRPGAAPHYYIMQINHICKIYFLLRGPATLGQGQNATSKPLSLREFVVHTIP